MRERCAEASILVFDAETTGIPDSFCDSSRLKHEILELSMLDGRGKILLDMLFKPEEMESWKHTEPIHGIRPQDVQDKPPAKEYTKEIQRLVDNADLLVAYNFQFDYFFLRSIGVSFKGKKYCDVMRLFTKRHNLKKYPPLEKCARFYSYDLSESHRAKADAEATLYCFHKLMEQENIYG